MPDVFKVSYEMPADHPAVAAHYEAVAKAAATTWAYVESVGAIGYYTSTWNGALDAVIFPDVVGRADHWKVLNRVYHPKAENHTAVQCVPKRTKIAAEVKAAFDAVPAIPPSRDLAHALGWTNSRVGDGSKIYFATVHKLETPTPRVFLRLPRQIDDGWEAPDFFIERTEGDLMRAIAAHNALVPKENPQ